MSEASGQPAVAKLSVPLLNLKVESVAALGP